MNIFKHIKDFFALLNEKPLKIISLVSSFLFLALIEVISLGVFSIYLKQIFEFKDSIQIFNFNLNQYEFILYGGIFGVLIFLLKNMLAALVQFNISSYTNYKGANMRVSYSNIYMNMPFIEFTKLSTSEIFNRINLYSSQFYLTISSVFKLITDILMIIFVIFFLIIIDVSALLILLVTLFVFSIIYLKFFVKKLNYFGEMRNNSTKNLNQGIYEFSFSYRESNLYRVSQFFLNKLKLNSYLIGYAQIRQEIVSNSVKYFLEIAFLIFLVSALTFKSIQGHEILYILSELSIFLLFGLRLIPVMNSFITNLSQIRFVGHAIKEISSDFKSYRYLIPPNEDYLEDLKIFKKKKNFSSNNHLPKNELHNFEKINFKEICFRYPNSTHNIIKNVNISITKGQKIGILGPSGSGKTTLILVILGFLKPNNGEIIFNSKILDEDNYHLFTSKVAYLPQEISIINDSVKSNIAFGIEPENINYNKLNEVIKYSKSEQFISKLQNGLDTVIGERGSQLSGGQRQRIAIARALYFEKEILIMDESTSNIDEKTEIEIIEELTSLDKNLTIIIIAHKKNIIEKCDSIFAFENDNLKKIK